MKIRRLPLWLALALAIGASSFGAFKWWRSTAMQRSASIALDEARTALDQGKPAEAIAALDRAGPATRASKVAQDLEVSAATRAMHTARLLAIWDREPDRIIAHEPAALLVHRALSVRGATAPAASIADAWRGKSAQPNAWTLTEVDGLIANAKGPDARILLDAAKGWNPPDEAQRLMRLALLMAPDDMTAAWQQLENAYSLDPKNADVRSFRGQIMEALGRWPEARVEYVAALVSEPDNALRRDQLAQFYIRCGDFDHAVPTWLDVTEDRSAGFMEVKGRFWARVVNPALASGSPIHWQNKGGAWSVALDAMELAPPGHWIASTDATHTDALRMHGEVWWLNLLDVFQSGNEADASTSLAAQPVMAANMAPELSAALRTVLALRAERSLENIVWPQLPRGSSSPAWFEQLRNLTAAARASAATDNPAILAVARHPAAIALTFAAGGWREAALRLHPWDSTAGLPDDMTYTIAMCHRLNRGPAAAATFLANASSPLLNGLAAECLIASGKIPDGLKRLAATASDNSDAGRRAAWLLCLASLEQRDFPTAAATLASSPGFADSLPGKEIAAKLALATGKTAEASALYKEAAAAGSPEGATWVLREAVKSGNHDASKEASMDLRELLPDVMQSRANQLHLPAAPPE
jgi:tetratricopeptide (TPR) repeat protein